MLGAIGGDDVSGAVGMLDAFASVGAASFDLTRLDIDGAKVGFEANCSFQELRRTIAERLAAAAAARQSLIIRPRSRMATLVQIDDLSSNQVESLTPCAFLEVETSPGNYQIWIAVSDGPRDSEGGKQFRARVRRAAGGDPAASGAVRIAGGFNFKKAYEPNFPVVRIVGRFNGRFMTVAGLERAGWLVELPPVSPSGPAGRRDRDAADSICILRPCRNWPDYQVALAGAKLRRDRSGPDRSAVDFLWSKWAVERGWSIEEVAAKLLDVSEKARERIRKGDHAYPFLTARNASRAAFR